jgi:hypothetical protein
LCVPRVFAFTCTVISSSTLESTHTTSAVLRSLPPAAPRHAPHRPPPPPVTPPTAPRRPPSRPRIEGSDCSEVHHRFIRGSAKGREEESISGRVDGERISGREEREDQRKGGRRERISGREGEDRRAGPLPSARPAPSTRLGGRTGVQRHGTGPGRAGPGRA